MSRCTRGPVRAVHAAVVLFGLAALLPAQGQKIGFEEEFALATDRAAVVAELIPGTEQHFYYQCLLAQHEGRFGEVPGLLAAWIKAHGRGHKVIEIENRQALLTFDSDPQASYAFLTNRLGLRFDHRREVPGAVPNLPTSLDQARISQAAMMQRALQKHPGSVDGLENSALRLLAQRQVDIKLLRQLLARLEYPDLPNLTALIARELEDRHSSGFGALPIHQKLTLAQLEDLQQRRPQLLHEQRFIDTWMLRLRPDDDQVWPWEPEVYVAYLDRLMAFAERLPAKHNSLKAQVLYHRLQHDLRMNRPSRERFMAYLSLPRNVGYLAPQFQRQAQQRGEVANLGRRYDTKLMQIGDDQALVRAYLERFLVDADDYRLYAPYLQDRWLRRTFAETKILAGVGDMQRWYALLDDPGYYEQLRDRVELRFSPTVEQRFASDEPVVLDLEVKNVDHLLVKVFEINSFNYHTAQHSDVDGSIDLDGLVANEERSLKYEVNPLRRVARRFEFPSIDHRGVYVIDFIGNGISSRAVIRKGQLQLRETPRAAGHVCQVLDERGALLPDASLWVGGREYAADEDGDIVLPYSTDPGQRQVILRHGEFSSMARLNHRAENYELLAGIHVERESLLSGAGAKLLLRPRLMLNGRPMSLEFLDEPVLMVIATDQDGITSSQVVTDLELKDDAELVHELTVPDGLISLRVSLRGEVKSLSKGKPERLASEARSFELNQIDATELTHCPLLGRNERGYVLDLLGKDGEPKADRAVRVTLRHADFRDEIEFQLKTDARGRIELGALDGMVGVRAQSAGCDLGWWPLLDSLNSLPTQLNGLVGETLRVPYSGRSRAPDRSEVALFEMRGEWQLRDAFEQVALVGGYLELRGLQPGNYLLSLKDEGVAIPVWITQGSRQGGWAIGDGRLLEESAGEPLQITGLGIDGETLRIELGKAGAEARVHVVASRYQPAFQPFFDLDASGVAGPRWLRLQAAWSGYQEGREIGDEYRYILERRYATKYPGNMLTRPGLLLNPWALEETATVTQTARAGGPSTPGPGGPATGGAGGRYGRSNGGVSARPGRFPNLDFLPRPAAMLSNLRPDQNGVVTVALAELGDGQTLHVLAIDGDSTVYRSVGRAEKQLEPKPRRLLKGLDPQRNLAQRRGIEFVDGGGTAVIEDLRTTELESFDTLRSVHAMFRTLSADSELQTFSFVLDWPQHAIERKRELYSKHACHELHFFLHQKDREFFDAEVRPYLANKLHKTFLDQWLLEEDLSGYLEPAAFDELNVVERILLARRLRAEAESVGRQIREQVELSPPQPAKLAELLRRALKGDALAKGGDDLYFGAAKSLGANERTEGDAELSRLRSELSDLDVRRSKEVAADEMMEAPEEEAGVAAAPEPSARRDMAGAKDKKQRQAARELYRAPDATRRYVEHNYWHRLIEQQNDGLVTANAFWRDYALADPERPFVSPQLIVLTEGGFTGMMMALAVLDLPFEAAKLETESEGARLTLRPGSPMLLVREEIAEAAPAAEDAAPVLVSQNLFRLDEPYRFDGNERRDAYLQGELLIDVAYGCRVVVTNPSSSPRGLELLLQIPEGAIPVRHGFETRGVPMRLEPYQTQTVEFAFYFPQPGTAQQYPVHVSEEGALVAAAEAARWDVRSEPSAVDTSSWAHVSQNASTDELLGFMNGANLYRLDLRKIAWRMRDREAFAAVIGQLRRRHHFDDLLWSYGLLHQDRSTAAEFMQHQGARLSPCGMALESPLLRIDPVERRAYQHVEYAPLFNARAHRLGGERRILNDDLAKQYRQLLTILGYRPELDSEDWLSVTYYLLLQDRVEEALRSFAKVDESQLPTGLQYDYFRAYLDFFSEQHALARGIAESYQDHPVERWRTMFVEVLRQLDEADGKAVEGGEGEDRTRRQTELAASEPALDLEVEARQVTLRYANLAQCQVSYYVMDVEFLFSTHPFVQQGSGSFAYVRPNRSDLQALEEAGTELAFELPAEFHNSNVLVEVSGGGLTRRQPYYSNSLVVRWFESYGQLQATRADDGSPLPRAYVKVFAKMPDGSHSFHKDGYTDLRGRFDYASLSGPDLATPLAFAVLVLSEDHGAVIQEITPPLR